MTPPDAGPRPVGSKRFGRNVLYSGISSLVPAAVAVVAVRITVRGLGADGYGVIALVGAIAGYFGILDLGLGRGILRFLAMFVSKREGATARDCVRMVLWWFAGVGVFGAVSMWVLAPWLAGSFLKVPPALVSVTASAFRIGGLGFALGMVASVLTLLPQAFLRYGQVSLLTVVLSTIGYAGPAILVSLGYGILPVIWFGVFANGLACAAWGAVGLRLLWSLPNEGPPFAEYRSSFMKFSWAVAANSVWTVIQGETSKVVVGVAGGLAQAGYFQVPNLISSKINGLLGSMSSVLLPTGSQLVAEGEHGRLVELYERSSRLFYLLNASMTAAVVVFAAPLLTTWIGDPRFGQQGGLAFALLMLAAGLNATSMAASHLNLAMGRPKVNLTFSLINSFINLATVYFFTIRYGIAGTAASGLLAAADVPFFLHYSHSRVLGVGSWGVFRRCYARITVAVGLVGVASWLVLRPFAVNLPVTLALVALTGAACLLASAALGAFTPQDWASLRAMLRRSPADGAEAPAAEEDGDE